MSEIEIKKISKRLKIPSFKFSICTIVNDFEEYIIMKSLLRKTALLMIVNI